MEPYFDSGLTDFYTWWLDHQDCIFRYTVYRRMFTPYEEEQKFMDETCWEDTYSTFATIAEAVQLPDGDILLGLKAAKDDVPQAVVGKLKDDTLISYYKLSEIRLEYYGMDNIYEEEDEPKKEDTPINHVTLKPLKDGNEDWYNHSVCWDDSIDDDDDGGDDE